jgi:hypothetical protein
VAILNSFAQAGVHLMHGMQYSTLVLLAAALLSTFWAVTARFCLALAGVCFNSVW